MHLLGLLLTSSATAPWIIHLVRLHLYSILGSDYTFLVFSYTAGLANHTTLFGFTGCINWQFLSFLHFGLSRLCILSFFVNFLKHLVDWHCLSLHKHRLCFCCWFLWPHIFVFHAWLYWMPITILGRWALLTITHSLLSFLTLPVLTNSLFLLLLVLILVLCDWFL